MAACIGTDARDYRALVERGGLIKVNDGDDVPWIFNGPSDTAIVTLTFFVFGAFNSMYYAGSKNVTRMPTTIRIQWMAYSAALPFSWASLIVFEAALAPNATVTDPSRAKNAVNFVLMTLLGMFGLYESNYKQIRWSILLAAIHFAFVAALGFGGIVVYKVCDFANDPETAAVHVLKTICLIAVIQTLWTTWAMWRNHRWARDLFRNVSSENGEENGNEEEGAAIAKEGNENSSSNAV